MGCSSWSSTDWKTYASASSVAMSTARAAGFSDTAARAQVFKQRTINPYLDPRGIEVRESRDSDLNPQSTAIIIGLDVTGSMGVIAEKMATESLGTLVEGIINRKPITDPHVMIMGIGDISYDSAPLQVSQFEADIKIAEQLADIYLEGGGGGNSYESYDLPWYFAARKTSIDCFEKRGKKGYIFTIGDELPPNRPILKRSLNDKFGYVEQDDIGIEQSLNAAQEKYNVFHVIVEQGNYCRSNKRNVIERWTELLGQRAIRLKDYTHLSEVILSVIQVSEGAEPLEVVNSWQDPNIKESVRYALNIQ